MVEESTVSASTRAMEGADEEAAHRGAGHGAAKAAWREALLELLHAEHPKTRGRVAFTSVATPLTTNFYLGVDRGET